LRVHTHDAELISWTPRDDGLVAPPRTATAPESPEHIVSVEQLFLTGQYLAQYRHATRSPLPYWAEALRRDPSHVGSNLAIASAHESAAEFSLAEAHIRRAIARLTDHVATPRDGEAHYRLGNNLVLQERDAEAIDPLSRAMWDAAWKHPAMYALARIHARRGQYAESSALLAQIVRADPDHLQAGCLLALTQRELGASDAWRDVIAQQLRADPLHAWARDIIGDSRTADATTLLDVALEYAETGFLEDALRVLDQSIQASASTPLGQVQVGPLVELHKARILDALGRPDAARAARARAHQLDSPYCLPSRLADVAALRSALGSDPHDALAHSLVGTWLYDRSRFEEAIAHWDAATKHMVDDDSRAVVLRNLGIAAYNVREDPELAAAWYRAALEASPTDSQLVAEYDQLLAKQAVDAATRLALLEEKIELVVERDDLTVAFANLLTDANAAGRAKQLLASRHFQPWEGGEGQVLAAWDRANLALCRLALAGGETREALTFVLAALSPPESLGEARHPLANTAELRLLGGDILHAGGDVDAARFWWGAAADSVGDFVGMKARNLSSATVWSILALWRLDRVNEAEELTLELRSHISELASSPPEEDFFATSLPSLLLFHDHPQVARDNEIVLLREQLELLSEAATTRLA
jgi:Tfp pilus assembly protein PilF